MVSNSFVPISGQKGVLFLRHPVHFLNSLLYQVWHSRKYFLGMLSEFLLKDIVLVGGSVGVVEYF